ncbi:MAG: RNA-binding S4 domain-containing protein [Janthinobacterium lividum]
MTRIDQWVWAVRLYRTRSIASNAIKSGHVRLNGERTKPSATVRAGDEVRVRAEGYEKVFAVVQLLEKRVGAPLAVAAYVDNSPPPPPKDEFFGAFGRRDRGAGRPTKRDRRTMDRLRTTPGGATSDDPDVDDPIFDDPDFDDPDFDDEPFDDEGTP